MLEIKQTEIDGVGVAYSPLMATPARNLLDKILNEFGPVLADAIERLEGSEVAKVIADFKASQGGDVKALPKTEAIVNALPLLAKPLGRLLRGFATSMKPSLHNELVNTLFKRVQLQTESMEGLTTLNKSELELLFGTNLLLETKILFWCLEVQYADFLSLLSRD